MKIVENLLGATAEAIVENPLIAAGLCAFALGYGIYKAGEAAVEAAPRLLDAALDGLNGIYESARDEVLTLVNGAPLRVSISRDHEPVETL